MTRHAIFSTRRKNLRILIDTQFAGNQTEFARAINSLPAVVNRWLTEHARDRRNISERTVWRIEDTCNLTPGWMDTAR